MNHLLHFAHSASEPQVLWAEAPSLRGMLQWGERGPAAIVVEVGGREPKMEQWMTTGEERTRGTGWHLLTDVSALQCFTRDVPQLSHEILLLPLGDTVLRDPEVSLGRGRGVMCRTG